MAPGARCGGGKPAAIAAHDLVDDQNIGPRLSLVDDVLEENRFYSLTLIVLIKSVILFEEGSSFVLTPSIP